MLLKNSAHTVDANLQKHTSSYHYHHARIGVDKYAGLRARVARAFADSKGRYGYRRIKAVLKTGVSEKVVRRIMAEEGLVAHVPSDAGIVPTRARRRRLPPISSTGTSRPSVRTRSG